MFATSSARKWQPLNMWDTLHFPPPRQRGISVHVLLIALCLLFMLAGVWGVTTTAPGPLFTGFVLLILAGLIPAPVLAYRLYSLIRSTYSLDREHLRLVWGLRVEEIPVADVEWVRPASDLVTPLQLPWPGLPGGLVGLVKHADMNVAEFMASEQDQLLLVATAKRVYVISPADTTAFLQAFQSIIEMGSLAQAPGRSVYPSFIVAEAWQNQTARFLWLFSLFVNIGLFVWVGLILPGLPSISLGFNAARQPLEPVPGVQLLLIPLLSVFFSLLSWGAGLFFYRRVEQRILSLILWAATGFTSLIFLFSVLFILTI